MVLLGKYFMYKYEEWSSDFSYVYEKLCVIECYFSFSVEEVKVVEFLGLVVKLVQLNFDFQVYLEMCFEIEGVEQYFRKMFNVNFWFLKVFLCEQKYEYTYKLYNKI